MAIELAVHEMQDVRHLSYVQEMSNFSGSMGSDENGSPYLNLTFEPKSVKYGWIDYVKFCFTIKHKDIALLKFIQAKSTHAILVHKRFDIVEYLSRWLSLKEIQELEVVVELFQDNEKAKEHYRRDNLEGLIMLVALRDEPNKPKHLREPEPPKEPIAQKPRVHKVFKSR